VLKALIANLGGKATDTALALHRRHPPIVASRNRLSLGSAFDAARYSSDVEATGVTVLIAKRADARKCRAARQASTGSAE
jgi:hypothetical protein